MELEKLATAAVTTSLAKTDRLSSFINSGDKEPCWDGNIYIHEGKTRTKKNIKKVATQIKGKAVSKASTKATIKYPISYDDLNAYMMNGGTMFFVVYLNEDDGSTIQIYYAELLPLKIKELFKTKKQNYHVVFRKFPTDNKQKTELFLNFYANAQRQASFAGKEIPTIAELTKQGVLESLSFHYTTLSKNGSDKLYPRMIDGKSLTLYANIKGGIAPIPVEYYDSIQQVTMSTTNDIPVSVNGIKFFDSYHVVYTANTVELKIGGCVSIVSPIVEEPTDTVVASVKVQFKGTLREKIVGMKLIRAMIEHRSITIGTAEFPINFPDEDLKNLEAKNLPAAISGYERAQSVLDKMNVKKDLEIDNCTTEEFDNLNLLVGTLGDNLPVRNGPTDTNRFHTMKISNLSLAVVYLPRANGGFTLHDYFGEHLLVTFKMPEIEEPVRISQFFSLSVTDMLAFDNINFNTIVEDVAMIYVNDTTVDWANNLLLEMIKAYDRRESAELLEAIKQLSEWVSKQKEHLSDEVVILNQLQIVKRERQLTFDEKAQLYSIVSKSDDEFFKLGAFLLLDEQEEAQKIIDTFEPEALDRFRAFPIYQRFYSENKND